MPVLIGKPPENDFTNPLGLLSDCHRRIERFLKILITVTDQLQGAELNDDMRKALEIALKYFREAAPKHTRDEEESLFPRLRDCQNPEVNSALEMIDALEKDHRSAEDAHNRIDILGLRWLSDGSLTAQDAKTLRTSLYELQTMYETHIAVEDNRLFPLAGEVLEQFAVDALGKEMAARRGIQLQTAKT
jgi:hemerythrin-like domain-containing protein